MSHTMMDVALTIDRIADRAARWMGDREIVSRRPDKSLARTTYREVIGRAHQLARALVGAGIAKGDRVATLMWNHAAHLEAYFGVPLAGAVLHTLNLRLHPDEIAYIANDAGDRVVLVDDVLVPLLDKAIASGARFERVIVVGDTHGTDEYEALLAGAPDVALPALAEHDALGTCYTSGTTGKPKGVVYSHRSTVLHTLTAALPDSLDLGRRDTVMPVVPMFHVNAWGIPYMAAMTGAKLVFPGPHLDAASLLDLIVGEQVTVAAGVPTIWLGIREALDAEPGRWKLPAGLRMIVGGSAAPEQLIRDFDRLGMQMIHAWGMTEMSPVGLVSRVPPELAIDADTAYRLRAKQGLPLPLLDLEVRNEAGAVPRDDKTAGEVLVRGPWIARAYHGGATPERWTADGMFRTGDVARMDGFGFVQLTDRIADLIKSGGEWIASQELENALMGHPAVREAAVIGVPHPRWSERPIAVYVLKPGATASVDELRAHLAAKFPKFWLPDAFERVETIPRTSAGKFLKTALRDQFRAYFEPR
ncbi:MAG TPA: long-chain fatty acid--CoA ligase [Kofleriaceae bacterium]|nr:long-chain fatty acid--CoA ligase [Kofleriaceae bacterium]